MGRITVRMPAFSATMQEGEITSWSVAVGDTVNSGQALAEVVTDKVDMELESPYAGTVVELVAAPGEAVRVGEPVVLLESEAEDLLGGLDLGGNGNSAPAAPSAPPAEAPSPPASTAIVPAPPPVRRRARELGLDLTRVAPTGSRGHVTHADLDRHVAESAPAAAPQPAAQAEVPPEAAAAPAPSGAPRDKRASLRAATARVVTRSAAIPQFTLYRRVDLTEARERKAGRSWTTEIARALAVALRRHPALNGQWDEQSSTVAENPQVRLGIAVDTPDGLVVVGIDGMDTVEASVADLLLRQAAERARAGALRPEDVQGVTCTVSNLGGFGIDRFNALLVPPQAAILSVGRASEIPLVVDAKVRPRLCMELGLTVDHRVADGADGARLLATVAELLEG